MSTILCVNHDCKYGRLQDGIAWNSISAKISPKGCYIPAQGNALGTRYHPCSSPERAKHIFVFSRFYVTLFQGSSTDGTEYPGRYPGLVCNSPSGLFSAYDPVAPSYVAGDCPNKRSNKPEGLLHTSPGYSVSFVFKP